MTWNKAPGSLGLATAIMLGMGHTPRVSSRPENKYKPCLNCGDLHKHNNSFCSPKCCKDWRERKDE